MKKEDLQKIIHSLEEHLTSINDNTVEIQALFDYIQEMESKMDRLSQRLDQLQLNEPKQDAKQGIMPLTQIETKVFLVLYTEASPVTFQEIANKSQLPLSFIPECISSLVQKGIPMQRSHCHNQLLFKLDQQFKELQAKENVVNLSLQSFLE